MTYAFSRDRAMPGLADVDAPEPPPRARLRRASSRASRALVITLPALEGDANGAPYAFFAVVSICVIGLYIAYVMPVYLRWRMGDAFEPGPWTLGKQVQVDQPGGDHLGRDLRGHLLPAVHARRRARGATSSTGSTSTTRRSPSAACC